MHRTGPRFLVLALILIAVPSFSTSATAKPSAGAALFEAKCSTCHQANGAGNPQMKAPVIAGFDRAYVRHQLTQFRTGRRGVEPMAQAMVRCGGFSFRTTDGSSSRAHVASLPPVSVQRSLKPTGFRGRGLYSGCSSCHGPSAEGNAALGAPRIAGQYTWYLRAPARGLSQWTSGR